MTLSPQLGASGDRLKRMKTGLARLGLASVLMAGVSLSGCATPAVAQVNGDLFEQVQVATGTAEPQTVLTGFLTGGPMAELVVIAVDENDDRHVRIYKFANGNWTPAVEARLRPEVFLVDVLQIEGRDRLITYDHRTVHWLDPDSAAEQPLVAIATPDDGAPRDRVPRIDVTRDLNDDGRDDLIVPDFDGFWISTQLTNGLFTDPVKLGPPEPFLDEIPIGDSRTYREIGINASTIPQYLSRVHQVDYDRDGRSDLVFWNQDHFDVYYQDEGGQFDPVAKLFATEVPFDSNGVYSLMFGFGDENTVSLLTGLRERTRQTVLYSLRDMDGDDVADMVTLSLEGRSLLRQRSQYRVYFGTLGPDGVRFAREPRTVLRPRGNAGGLQPWGYASQRLQDFDDDGRIDVMFLHVTVGVGGMTRAILANSVALDLEFYRMDDGLYPGQPDERRRIRPDAEAIGRRGPFFPPVLLGDVNGDGRADLVVGKSREELSVFVGTSGPSLFAEAPRTVSVALSDNESHTWLADVNQDAKQDVLVYQPSDSEPHRVTILIAR